jgi:hypothetical protein
MERYIKWLNENGATFDAIEWPTVTPGTGRGAVAKKNVSPGEAFLTVPSRLILDPPFCRRAPDIGPFLASHQMFAESDETTLAVYLCHESLKGVHSFWEPYISMLPKPSGSVYCWTREELDELQDPGVTEVALRSGLKERKVLYEKIVSLIDRANAPFKMVTNKITFTFDLFSWATDTVNCRSFGKRIKYVSLVPLADNLNHSNVQTKYSYDGNVFKLFPTGNNFVKQGEEAFNSYGRRSNTDLIFNYGFALENNEWDEVSLVLALAPEAASNPRKRRLLAGSIVAKLKKNEECRSLFTFFRVSAANEEDLNKMCGPNPSMMNYDFQSFDHELRSLNMCKRELQAILSTFPTTIEEDERILKTADSNNSRLVFAVRFRLGTKKVLEFHVNYIEMLISFVQQLDMDSKPNQEARDALEYGYSDIAAKLMPAGTSTPDDQLLSDMMAQLKANF